MDLWGSFTESLRAVVNKLVVSNNNQTEDDNICSEPSFKRVKTEGETIYCTNHVYKQTPEEHVDGRKRPLESSVVYKDTEDNQCKTNSMKGNMFFKAYAMMEQEKRGLQDSILVNRIEIEKILWYLRDAKPIVLALEQGLFFGCGKMQYLKSVEDENLNNQAIGSQDNHRNQMLQDNVHCNSITGLDNNMMENLVNLNRNILEDVKNWKVWYDALILEPRNSKLRWKQQPRRLVSERDKIAELHIVNSRYVELRKEMTGMYCKYTSYMPTVNDCIRHCTASTQFFIIAQLFEIIVPFLKTSDIGNLNMVNRILKAHMDNKWWQCGASKSRMQQKAFWKHSFWRPTYGRPTFAFLVKKASSMEVCKCNLIDRDVSRTTFVLDRDIYTNCPRKHKFVRLGECRRENNGMKTDQEMQIVQHYQKQLHEILIAYAIHNTRIGYGQGMSFLAGFLLSATQYNTNVAFNAFATLMDDYEICEMYRDGLKGTMVRLSQLERAIKLNLAELHYHFEQHNIRPIMFASGWFMTLFCNDMTIHPSILIKIVDIFIQHRWPGLLQLMLGLLHFNQNQLVGTSMSITLQRLSKLSNTFTIQNFPTILQHASRMFVHTFHIQLWEIEHSTE